ncbi:tetratricopeptide repeat-containing sulfotransferase family protein [Pseudooceanicola nitratireducens]|uniref:tetratricopeptide repeat-containing sulfotransferase family protein n=1 Tax=Pseudooceanicola nitratireducens TaxID=517719 RepID=UPI0033401D25
MLSRAAQAFQSGRLSEAEAIYTRILQSTPTNVKALVGAALCASTLRRDAARALSLLDRALQVSPRDAHVHQSRAATLNMLGDFDGAVQAARRAIDLNPAAAHAYVNLTDSMRVAPGDPLIARGEAALKGAMSDADRSVLHFALGKAWQDCGDYDRAFTHFRGGNDLKPAFTGLETFAAVADRQKALFTAETCARLKGAARTTPRPIFIVGMPRSGTTLLERMLAAHPEVSTAGERPEVNHLSSRFFDQAQRPGMPPDAAIRQAMTRDALADIARAYVTQVTPRADAPAPQIIDKMPTNFWNIGLIAACFADAPILHMRRHPLDTGLSNYIANFRTGLDYSNRLDTLGGYFRIYDDLMRHWTAVLPTRILDVDYEKLVQDPKGQMRRILSFCQLGWHDGCVHPEKTTGVIATASRFQARQKITTGSVHKWQRYAAHLSPLIDALGGEDWIAGYEARRA